MKLPAVADRPDAAAIRAARDLWLEAVEDFPFASASDRTHAIVAGLLPFGRDVVMGPTPLHLFEAPMWGTGKTLLASGVFYPFLGEFDTVQPEPESSAEWRKRLLTLLSEGAAVAIIDNVADALVAGPLMGFITSQAWRDRILGVTRSGHYANRLILAITGNNVVLSGEAIRRCVRSRLLPRTPKPWQRDPERFRHSDLAGWLQTRRSEFIGAALTLWRAWFAAGCPDAPAGTPAFGKFEAYRSVMGGLCGVVGFEGFLENLRDFYDETPTTDEKTQTFAVLWWQKYRGASVPPVPELLDLAHLAGMAFEGKNRQGEVVSFGIWLVKQRDRLFELPGSYWAKAVREQPGHAGERRWHLTAVDPEDGESGESPEPSRSAPARAYIGATPETHQSHHSEGCDCRECVPAAGLRVSTLGDPTP